MKPTKNKLALPLAANFTHLEIKFSLNASPNDSETFINLLFVDAQRFFFHLSEWFLVKWNRKAVEMLNASLF